MLSPKRYRKRPVEVEAMEFTAETAEDVARWVTESGADGRLQGVRTPSGGWIRPRLLIYCALEGTMQAKVSDYIIKGVQGEMYPCDAAVFAQTYEEA